MKNVMGHENTKQVLENSIKSKRINHAYIFEGPSGVGRLTLAKAFAVGISGDDKFTADSNPDIIIATNARFDPSKKTAGLSIDATRALKADVYIRPYRAEKKVYIIPNADAMLDVAQNSLLKIFEEPPEYCVIILTAQNANLLLQTIRSRAQLIRLSALSFCEVSDYLMAKQIDKARADSLAALSGGSIGKALSLLDDNEAIQRREAVISHILKLLESGSVTLYDFIKYLKQNKSDISAVFDILTSWATDVLHIKSGVAAECGILNADKKAELEKFCSAITKKSATAFCEITTKYILAVNRNINYPIAMQCMATEYWEEIHGRSYRSTF